MARRTGEHARIDAHRNHRQTGPVAPGATRQDAECATPVSTEAPAGSVERPPGGARYSTEETSPRTQGTTTAAGGK